MNCEWPIESLVLKTIAFPEHASTSKIIVMQKTLLMRYADAMLRTLLTSSIVNQEISEAVPMIGVNIAGNQRISNHQNNDSYPVVLNPV